MISDPDDATECLFAVVEENVESCEKDECPFGSGERIPARLGAAARLPRFLGG